MNLRKLWYGTPVRPAPVVGTLHGTDAIIAASIRFLRAHDHYEDVLMSMTTTRAESVAAFTLKDGAVKTLRKAILEFDRDALTDI